MKSPARVWLFKFRFAYGAYSILGILCLFHAYAHAYFQENWWASFYLVTFGCALHQALWFRRVLKKVQVAVEAIAYVTKALKQAQAETKDSP